MKKVTSYILILVLTISSFSPFYCMPKSFDITKEEQWQLVTQKVDTWRDTLDKPIDTGIKKTVIILNLLGFEIDMKEALWGDSKHLYPSLEIIKAHGIDLTIQGLDILLDKRRIIENTIKYGTHSDQELEALHKESKIISEEIRQLPYPQLLPLLNLLDSFYKKKSIDADRMLALSYCNLLNLGGEWQITRNESEKLKKLKEYQEEMKEFTDFLIEYWKSL